MTYQELIHTYPPEKWAWKGKDYHCTICYDQGEPCRERIICDIADIQDNLEATGLFVENMEVLTWLHEHRYSTLTHSIAQLTAMFRAQRPTVESVLFSTYSAAWHDTLPTTLIRYGTGKIDLHCQTGNHHLSAIKQAAVRLAQMGLQIEPSKESIYPTGVYYTITPLPPTDADTYHELALAGAHN